MLQEVKDAMARFTAQANSLPKSELLRAVYDMAVHEFGANAVGEFDEYVRVSRNYWTFERCKASALKFKTRKKWANENSKASQAAYRNGWYEECCSHMSKGYKPKGYWTLERCKESALRFKTRKEWARGESGACNSAFKSGWYEECCSHMDVKARKPHKYWTIELCKESASKFISKSNWKSNDGGAFAAARKNGWLDECIAHMTGGSSKNA